MKVFTLLSYFYGLFVLSAQTPEWIQDLYDEPWISERGPADLSGWYPRPVGRQAGKLWSLDLQDSFSSPPVMRDGRLYCAGTSGIVYCCDINGKIIWKTATGDSFEAGALALGDRVIVGALSGKIYALDKWTGRVLWTFVAEGRLTAGANVMSVGQQELVLAGTYSGFLYALDALSGEQVWRTQAESFINGSAAVEGRFTVFGSCDGKLRLLDAQGHLLWVLGTESYIPESSTFRGGSVFAASYSGTLYKVEASTGKIQWQKMADEEGAFFTSPAVSPQYVVCATKDDILYAYQTDSGKPVAAIELDGTLSGSPIIAGTSILWITASGTLTVVDLKVPSIKPFVTLTGTRPAGGFMISQKKIYFCTMNGQIHCWRME